jgi:uncharacterized protein YpmB
MKRGQSTIEFVIIFGFILFFFVLFFAAIQKNIAEKNHEKDQKIVQNIALEVQNEISLAAESSEGYYREFSIPQNIMGKDYEISIEDNVVYARMGEKIAMAYNVPLINDCSLIKGANIIKKQGGVVYLNC